MAFLLTKDGRKKTTHTSELELIEVPLSQKILWKIQATPVVLPG